MVLIDKNRIQDHRVASYNKTFDVVGFFVHDFVYDENLFVRLRGQITRQVKRETENNIVRIL